MAARSQQLKVADTGKMQASVGESLCSPFLPFLWRGCAYVPKSIKSCLLMHRIAPVFLKFYTCKSLGYRQGKNYDHISRKSHSAKYEPAEYRVGKYIMLLAL